MQAVDDGALPVERIALHLWRRQSQEALALAAEWDASQPTPEAMSWGILHAALGLRIADGAYRFDPRLPGVVQRLLFSHGTGLATYRQKIDSVRITVHSGAMCMTACACPLRPSGRNLQRGIFEKLADLGHQVTKVGQPTTQGFDSRGLAHLSALCS